MLWEPTMNELTIIAIRLMALFYLLAWGHEFVLALSYGEPIGEFWARSFFEFARNIWLLYAILLWFGAPTITKKILGKMDQKKVSISLDLKSALAVGFVLIAVQKIISALTPFIWVFIERDYENFMATTVPLIIPALVLLVVIPKIIALSSKQSDGA